MEKSVTDRMNTSPPEASTWGNTEGSATFQKAFSSRPMSRASWRGSLGRRSSASSEMPVQMGR